MGIFVELLLLMILTVNESMQRANQDSATYKAATVEYRPFVYKDDPERTLRENAQEYGQLIHHVAEDEDTDIIVFPEFGLTSLDLPNKSELFNWSTLVPDPDQNFKPCGNTTHTVSEVLKTIACNAEHYTIFVVVNVIEREKCSGTDCPSYGYHYYSTNVVFHQSGALIARYRRSYQTDDLPQLDLPKVSEISTFTTTFGVKFANVIGMDILYEEPLRSLLEEQKITDVVYTAAWHNVIPFETATQIQSGWSYAKNVNLLAAGLNDVAKGYSGSGIYAGKQKTLESTLMKVGSKPLLENVSKKRKPTHGDSASHGHPTHDELPRSIRYRDGEMTQENLDGFKSKPITEKGSTKLTLTDNEITCEFDVNVSNLSPSDTYHFVAHDTGAPAGNETVRGTRICAIIQCADAISLRSCSISKSSTTNFNYVKITASYVDNGRTFMMPNTLANITSNLKPINDFTFEESMNEGRTVKVISLTKPTQDLVTFGIWGRNFATDVPNMASSSNFYKIFWPVIILCVLLVLLAFISYRYKDRIAEVWQRLKERFSKTSIENDTLRRPEMHPRLNGESTVPLREGA